MLQLQPPLVDCCLLGILYLYFVWLVSQGDAAMLDGKKWCVFDLQFGSFGAFLVVASITVSPSILSISISISIRVLVLVLGSSM